MLSFRQKLRLAFGGMLIILATVGGLSSLLLQKYGNTIEQVFRENYDSVIYSQNMKDAIDDLEDLAHNSLNSSHSENFIRSSQPFIEKFLKNLEREKGNITLPGEQEAVNKLIYAWNLYLCIHETFGHLSPTSNERSVYYREKLHPQARTLKHLAQGISTLNVLNVVSVDGQIKESTTIARRAMAILIAIGITLGVLLTITLSRAMLRSLDTLTISAYEIARGNLDLTVDIRSHDELGRLAEAFNAMAAKLREYRRSDRAKLIRAQKTTQLALNTFPDAILIVNLDGKIELANETAQRLFRLAPGEDLAGSHIKGLLEIFQQACSSLQTVHPQGYEAAIQAFVGSEERFYLPQGVPIFSEDRYLTGVTLVLADVTELRRLDEMKSGLLSVASHELRTPLTSLRMAIHLLLDERLGPLSLKQADILITAREDAERLNSLIERLLDMGRIESGRALLDWQPVSIEQLVTDVMEQFAVTYRERGVQLQSELDEGLPPVLADPSRLGIVLSNLLDNALKYTNSGGKVTIVANRIENIEGGPFVAISISDTGSGIPADALPHIFERFYRASRQPQGIKGAGLGLAIAREIVEAHGGTISVKSQEGVGSQFTLRLKSSEKIHMA